MAHVVAVRLLIVKYDFMVSAISSRNGRSHNKVGCKRQEKIGFAPCKRDVPDICSWRLRAAAHVSVRFMLGKEKKKKRHCSVRLVGRGPFYEGLQSLLHSRVRRIPPAAPMHMPLTTTLRPSHSMAHVVAVRLLIVKYDFMVSAISSRNGRSHNKRSSAVRGVTTGPKNSGDVGRLCGVPIESESVVQYSRLCCIRMFENLLTSFSA
ncbi:hypothetical protein NDU88_007419 [Pleurodeles waltl]|uniref:Uncharacterized protein n=1 Tax=Pleurodeles waltl TaxID=8319 RepID=A0AAV7N485_PLEWA|nr:hypothetical protein NDU88_007419 [Pleurodeles waltl]